MKMNSLIKKSAGALASLALVGGAVAMAAGPAAADIAPTELEIQSGDFSFGLEPVSFTPRSFSFSAQSTDAEARLDVTDERGTADGWSVTAVASNLEHDDYNPGAPDPLMLIPNSGITVTGFDDFVTADGAVMGSPGALNSPLVLMGAEAGAGEGDSSASIDFSLAIPAGTKLGNYSGEITYTQTGPLTP